MKNYTYIGISFIVLVFGILVFPKIMDRLQSGTVVQNDRLNGANEKALVNIAPAPHFKFTNQNNEVLTNDFYKGKVYLVEFFFTSCPTICPVMNENMVILQNDFKLDAHFGIASFTIDPLNDTPEELKKHAAEIGAVSKNWNFFTGTQDDLFALAKKFNMYVGQSDEAPGGFEHSGMFALIDKEGNIRSRKDSFGNPIVFYDGIEKEGIQMLREDIKKLLAE